ncbi:DNA-binding domain-containing protein [Bremerella sp. JC817]|uniref:DNA-binding domain-containing protein n=1 Tax=Bremerella sp. JC817 TaxID=3231756 RepID=UPI0034584755
MASDSPKPVDLPILQQWMHSVISHVGGVVEGIEDNEARRLIDVSTEEIETVITPSQRRTSIQRLEVYANAYYARLVECLKSIFPVFAQTVGDELFDQFAIAYLQQYPSRSYTLDRLGDHFPQFLRETSPEAESPGFEHFLVELATIERSIDDVFDGPGVEGKEVITAADLEGISPDDFWQARLTVVPCLRWHRLTFPINEFLTRARTQPQPDVPEAAPSFLALTRRDFVVRRVPLTHFQIELISRLAASQSVGEAIEDVLNQLGEPDDLPGMIASAFQKFATEQFFAAISS